jgi:hypothetical protein
MTEPSTPARPAGDREPDREVARSAIAIASRAPSVHNSQPWLWWIGDSVIQLHADMARWLPVTDGDGRDLLVSCGAALHHLRVALAALGVDHHVDRLPDPEQPDLLARVRLGPGRGRYSAGVDPAQVGAVMERRTDRRPYRDWPVPGDVLAEFAARAAAHGALLRPVTDPRGRDLLAAATRSAAEEHRRRAGYDTELALWSGRHATADGVPATSVPSTPGGGHGIPPRRFAHGELDTPAVPAEDGATLVVLGTASDDELSRLRSGEALSAVLLHATTLELATCPLSECLEVADTRALVGEGVLDGSVCPQLLVRVGWPASAPPIHPTARRPVDEQIVAAAPHW